MGDGDAVQSFHTLKQVVCISSAWMHWLLLRCSHPNDRDVDCVFTGVGVPTPIGEPEPLIYANLVAVNDGYALVWSR